MSVTINLASYLRSYVDGRETIEVNGNTIRECFDDLVRQYPGLKAMLFDKNNKLLDYVSVFAGGEITYADQLDKPVKNGDLLHILYIIGGG